MLRFLTCGSVDDGKSTLIGRLLYDSKMIYEDQLAAIERDSKIHGTTGGRFDPALLTDGLRAEREQGITIDVAYRYFSTAKRKFIIADTPGHEQYTRNMATGAFDRRPGHHPDRCPAWRADTDQAPLVHHLPARHPPRAGGDQQDGPGGLPTGGVREDPQRLQELRGPTRICRTCISCPSRHSTETTWSNRACTCPGTEAAR